MKFRLFIVCFSCLTAKHNFQTAPEVKPLMYFDGVEWKTMKPNRNATSGTRSQISAFLDFHLPITKLNVTASDNHIDLNTTPQSIIAKVFGDHMLREIQRKAKYNSRTVLSDIENFKSTANSSNDNILLDPVIIGTDKLKTNPTNTTLTTDPKDWIQLMLELSDALKEIAGKQNVSYYTQVLKSKVYDIPSAFNATRTVSAPNATNVTKVPKKDKPKSRRALDGLDDLVALLTGGIEIDNGSDSSIELSEDRKAYLRKMLSSNAQITKGNTESDSGDIFSDGIEETRYVIVEDKSAYDDVKIRNK